MLYRRELAALKLTTTLSTRITGETSRSGCTAVWSSFAVPGGSLRRCRRMASLANYGAALHVCGQRRVELVGIDGNHLARLAGRRIGGRKSSVRARCQAANGRP